MLVWTKKTELLKSLSIEKKAGNSIGFVPTMGALHEGHLSLIRQSILENNITVCSIFVNPTQFNNQEDLVNYPVRADEDLKLLDSAGCQYVFVPGYREMYDYDLNEGLSINFGSLETLYEGKYRPGHFKGVGLIVTKLFAIIQPDRAYFGQKDLQQFAVVGKLVHELSFTIELRRVPTVREPDGLAMSSRNQRILPGHRPGAVIFYQSLLEARSLLKSGMPMEKIKQVIASYFTDDSTYKIEYLELVERDDFRQVSQYTGQSNLALCIAGYAGKIRLIDNIFINE